MANVAGTVRGRAGGTEHAVAAQERHGGVQFVSSPGPPEGLYKIERGHVVLAGVIAGAEPVHHDHRFLAYHPGVVAAG